MTETKKNIWIFSFEFAGVVKVGGLGEVPANQVKHLSDEFNITVFMPSHGKIEELKSKYTWNKLDFNCLGSLIPSSFSNDITENTYHISFYQFDIGNVKVIVLSGENQFTSKYLEDITVYNPDTFIGKVCLYSIGMRAYINQISNKETRLIPHLIHMHDYHVVLGFINVKQVLTSQGVQIPSIITIHLLTYPRFDISIYRQCGIDDTNIRVMLPSGGISLKFNDIYMLARSPEEAIPTVEKIGALISDLVTTVSESYLKSDIIPNCGKDLIEFKSDFIWDGCDWDYYEIYKEVIKTHKIELSNFFDIPVGEDLSRDKLKKFLLEHKIGNLTKSPLINSPRVLNVINEVSNGSLFVKNGRIKAFSETGPLVLTTGRISPQKGFETIFEAIPEVVNKVPNVKFLFLVLPTDYSLNEIRNYSEYVKQFPNNIRIIYGVASDIFYLAHISANIYCSLSRWEPFGIMALEAMASKIPIIASRVGGLQETIIDLRHYPDIGTGVLIEKNNPKQFSEALISLLKAFEVSQRINTISDHNKFDPEILQMINQIPDEVIKSNVLLNPNYYNKVQENCYRRVKKNFSWKQVSKKLVELYHKLIKLNSF